MSSSAAGEKWDNEESAKIAKRVRIEGAESQWEDETGLHSDSVGGHGYAPKGPTPVILTSANREKLGVISTVANKGQTRWKIFSGAFHEPIPIGSMGGLSVTVNRRSNPRQSAHSSLETRNGVSGRVHRHNQSLLSSLLLPEA